MNHYYLAFDYGTQFIGTAVGQTVTLSARPLSEIKVRKNKVPWVDIQKLVQHWQPHGFVVGLPLYADGTESPLAKKSSIFAEQLTKRFQLPHYLIDERLSTYEAKQQYYELRKEGIKSTESSHCVSAQLILESWLVDQQSRDSKQE